MGTYPLRVATSHTIASDDEGTSSKRLEQIYRKIDWAVVPLLFLCYFLQFLDKVLINYANIMGIDADLNLKDNDFSWLATALFIGYAAAELPQGYLIQRFSVAKVLGANVVLWGVIVSATAATQNFAGAAAVRTLLGACEAVITPALVIITSQFYTKRQATPRTGLWYCGLGAGQTIGGLISFAAQHGSKTAAFPGWRIMFVSVGAFNLLVGTAVLLWLPDGVRDANFLSEEEKDLVEAVLARDQAGSGRKEFRKASIMEALGDLQVWLLCLNTLLIIIPSGIITTFSATLISSFGYGPKQAALLNMPSGIISIISTLIGTIAILYNLPRWLSIIALLIPTMIGAGLMSFQSDKQGSALAGIYLINFDVAPLALIYAMAGANIQGYTKKVTTNALIAIAFAIGNIIGPQTFQVKDAPDYFPAKVTVFAVCGGSIVVTVALRLLYGARNRRTAAARRAELEAIDRGGLDAKVVEEAQTDRTNPAFQYVY